MSTANLYKSTARRQVFSALKLKSAVRAPPVPLSRSAWDRKKGRTCVLACPTCGRTRIDLIPLAEEVERRLADCPKDITVAVMGCAVNGPGEASAADIGIAGGNGEGLLFRKGEILRKVPQDQLLDALMAEIEKL